MSLATSHTWVFSVDIKSSANISFLKDAIKVEMNQAFNNFSASRLKLWQVSFLVVEILKETADAFDVNIPPLLSVKRLDSLFNNPDPDYVHILIQPPTPPAPPAAKNISSLQVTNKAVIANEEDETILKAWKRFDRVLARPGLGNTPSQNVKSPAVYRKHQDDDTRLLDSRYGSIPTLAPPVELFHPAFAEFKAHLVDTSLEPPSDIISETAALMDSPSEIIRYEDDRIQIRRHLEKLCLFPAQTTHNKDKTALNYVMTFLRDTTPTEPVLIALFEEKAEMGLNGDPSLQGAFSYVRYWADQSHCEIREACCCPSFIIGIAGPWITILGAVLTTNAIVQRLTDYIWMGHSRVIDDIHTLRVAKIFYSLRLAMHTLSAYYRSFVPPPKKSLRFFPSITSYTVGDRTVQFRYQRALKPEESCVSFLAWQLTPEGKDEKLIVVKFVERYGEQVHRLLVSEKLAPKLYYFGPLISAGTTAGPTELSYGHIRMVVVQYIEGQTAGEKYNDGVKIPASLKERARKAVKSLSQKGLVHGNLRRPNILIPKDGGEEKSVILDFDWAAKAGEVRYPLRLSGAVKWADGVKDYELIQSAHDVEMMNGL